MEEKEIVASLDLTKECDMVVLKEYIYNLEKKNKELQDELSKLKYDITQERHLIPLGEKLEVVRINKELQDRINKTIKYINKEKTQDYAGGKCFNITEFDFVIDILSILNKKGE